MNFGFNLFSSLDSYGHMEMPWHGPQPQWRRNGFLFSAIRFLFFWLPVFLRFQYTSEVMTKFEWFVLSNDRLNVISHWIPINKSSPLSCIIQSIIFHVQGHKIITSKCIIFDNLILLETREWLDPVENLETQLTFGGSEASYHYNCSASRVYVSVFYVGDSWRIYQVVFFIWVDGRSGGGGVLGGEVTRSGERWQHA